MAAVNAPRVSPEDCGDFKASRAELLRGIVAEKLTTAAEEIFAAVERTVAGYEEEAAGLRREIDRQRSRLELLLQPRVTLCRTEEPVCDEEEEEEEEEPVQSISEGQEDLRDPDHQNPDARGQSERRRRRGRRGHLSLRVCLLKDSDTRTLKRGVLKPSMQNLRCPRGLQEPDFLDLLRSTFPQLSGQFDVFTVDASRKLTPLRVQTLTPEMIQRSIRSTGKGRSALYVRVKRAEKSPTSTERLPPPQRKDEAADSREEEHWPPASSHSSPAGTAKSRETDGPSSCSRRRQQLETEDGEEGGVSHDLSGLSSARSAAESKEDSRDDGDDGVEDGDRDEEWRPDKNDEELREGEAEPTRTRQVKRPDVRTKRRRRLQSSAKASTQNGDAPPSCRVCGVLRGSTNMLIKHAWTHVDDPERLCGACGEHSESAEELRNHLQSHQKTHSCNICGKSFLSARTRDQHVIVHTGEKPYRCEICHKAYLQKASLSAHRWEHVEEKPHKCDICNQSFAFKQQLRIHSRIHTGEKPFCCDLCGKSVGDARSLYRHMLSHSGEKRYGCRVCGKCFRTPGYVKTHEKIHTDRDKVHLCDVCCKVFHTPGQLKAHLKTHCQKKITCSQCGKGLSSRGALSRHMTIHRGERPYRCSECGQAFNAASTLRSHLKTHSGVRQFVCGVCGKACARKEHLTVHMRTHNGEKPYECAVCDKAFTQSHCLKTHMRIHEGGEKTAEDEQRDSTVGSFSTE